MRFKEAVSATTCLSDSFREGLQALKRPHRSRIHCEEPRNLAGSIDLDAALEELNPDDTRWDYAIGWRAGANAVRVVWVEVHPASSNHVKEVLQKLRWLKGWLRDSGSPLKDLRPAYFWLATGSVSIQPGSPQARRLAQAGLKLPRKAIELPGSMT